MIVVNPQPWQQATGPRTVKGKRRSAADGHYHDQQPGSRRHARAGVVDVNEMISEMAGLRGRIAKHGGFL